MVAITARPQPPARRRAGGFRPTRPRLPTRAWCRIGRMSAAITPGLHARFSYTVTDADTAAALESGLVPVLSTPRVLALMERATVEALEGALEQGATTVGAKVELEHLLATPVGAPVEVSATLERLDGRRLE